jgi:hypothetical protein
MEDGGASAKVRALKSRTGIQKSQGWGWVPIAKRGGTLSGWWGSDRDPRSTNGICSVHCAFERTQRHENPAAAGALGGGPTF